MIEAERTIFIFCFSVSVFQLHLIFYLFELSAGCYRLTHVENMQSVAAINWYHAIYLSKF